MEQAHGGQRKVGGRAAPTGQCLRPRLAHRLLLLTRQAAVRGQLKQVWAVIYVLSRTTLATSRKLLEEQEQKQDQLQALQEAELSMGGGGRRQDVLWARVEAVERGIHSWALAIF